MKKSTTIAVADALEFFATRADGLADALDKFGRCSGGSLSPAHREELAEICLDAAAVAVRLSDLLGNIEDQNR